nr:hypothetical protein [uncultured archaeon]
MVNYRGDCEECGEFHDDLLEFRGRKLCWPCIKRGRKPVGELTADRLKHLVKSEGSGHPYTIGEPYARQEIIAEIEDRGAELLEELGWPSDKNAVYRNLHTGTEETLEEILKQGRKWGEWHSLYDVIEHHKPAKGKNRIRAKYLAGKKGCHSLDEFGGRE